MKIVIIGLGVQGYKRIRYLKNDNIDHAINTLSMASPFSIEEKQILLETFDTNSRKSKLEEIENIDIFTLLHRYYITL